MHCLWGWFTHAQYQMAWLAFLGQSSLNPQLKLLEFIIRSETQTCPAFQVRSLSVSSSTSYHITVNARRACAGALACMIISLPSISTHCFPKKKHRRGIDSPDYNIPAPVPKNTKIILCIRNERGCRYRPFTVQICTINTFL